MFDETKVLCYFDFESYTDVDALETVLDVNNYDDTVSNVCGGLFVDNYEEKTDEAQDEFFKLYEATQVFTDPTCRCFFGFFLSPTDLFISMAREQKGTAVDETSKVESIHA